MNSGTFVPIASLGHHEYLEAPSQGGSNITMHSRNPVIDPAEVAALTARIPAVITNLKRGLRGNEKVLVEAAESGNRRLFDYALARLMKKIYTEDPAASLLLPPHASGSSSVTGSKRRRVHRDGDTSPPSKRQVMQYRELESDVPDNSVLLLPDDALHNILLYSEPCDVLTFMVTCSRFNAIGHTFNLNAEDFSVTLMHGRRYHYSYTSDMASSVADNDLHVQKMSPRDSRNLVFLSRCTHLTRLNLTQAQFVNDKVISAIAKTGALKHLQEINLSGVPTCTSLSIKALLKYCPSLKSISQRPASDGGKKHSKVNIVTLKAFGSSNTIESLSFCTRAIDCEGFSSLQKMPNLTCLNLSLDDWILSPSVHHSGFLRVYDFGLLSLRVLKLDRRTWLDGSKIPVSAFWNFTHFFNTWRDRGAAFLPMIEVLEIHDSNMIQSPTDTSVDSENRVLPNFSPHCLDDDMIRFLHDTTPLHTLSLSLRAAKKAAPVHPSFLGTSGSLLAGPRPLLPPSLTAMVDRFAPFSRIRVTVTLLDGDFDILTGEPSAAAVKTPPEVYSF
jgi:hypothetical protein